jgi:hypothetical protein
MDDVDKLPSFDAGEAPRRSTSSLGDKLSSCSLSGRRIHEDNRVF